MIIEATEETIKERKVDRTIKVDDVVRSYDFDGCDSCYYEGVVEDIEDWGHKVYKIAAVRRVFNGESKRKFNDFIFPPVNGTTATFGGLTCGVQKI